MTALNSTLPIASIKLKTTTKLTSAGKEYLCSQINGKSSHAAQCVKLRIMKKSIDYILSIDTFEQQCVVIKGMLISPRLKYNMENIGMDQLLISRACFEHTFLNNIKIYINMLVSVMTKII